MAYGDFKDLPRREITEKILRDKKFNIGGNSTRTSTPTCFNGL